MLREEDRETNKVTLFGRDRYRGWSCDICGNRCLVLHFFGFNEICCCLTKSNVHSIIWQPLVLTNFWQAGLEVYGGVYGRQTCLQALWSFSYWPYQIFDQSIADQIFCWINIWAAEIAVRDIYGQGCPRALYSSIKVTISPSLEFHHRSNSLWKALSLSLKRWVVNN